MLSPDGMQAFYHCAEKKGYSGVGIWSRVAPDRVVEGFDGGEFDTEGRYIRADFGNLSVISLYLPSGSSSPERQEAKFRFLDCFFPQMLALRAEGREIVLCGDWNIAHREIDLKNWKSNQKNSGFLPEERAWLSKVFDELGWVDVYRCLHPEPWARLTPWWSNRGQAWPRMSAGGSLPDGHPGAASAAQRAEVYKAEPSPPRAAISIMNSPECECELISRTGRLTCTPCIIFIDEAKMSEQFTTANKDKLVSDLKVVISDTEELLRATAGAAGEKVGDLRERLGIRLRDAKERLVDLEVAVIDKTKAAARATDDFVHEEPWKAVGVAAAWASPWGVLIGRR